MALEPVEARGARLLAELVVQLGGGAAEGDVHEAAGVGLGVALVEAGVDGGVDVARLADVVF